MSANRTSFWKKNPVLLNKEYRAFLTIRFGLIFALSMQFTIVTYWIYHITGGSKLALGMVGLAEVIPVICCSLFSGHFVDVKEKRNLLLKLIVGYIFLGTCLFYLSLPHAGVFFSTQIIIASIYGFIFLGGILRSFLGPATFSLIGLIVPREQYANATSWGSMAWRLGAVLGPLLSGTIIAIKGIEVGMGMVVLFEILMFLPALYIKKKPVLKTSREPILQSIGEGLKFVLRTPELLGAQLLDMFSVLFGGAVALLPAVQNEFFPPSENFFSGAMAFGFLRAAPGIGALITLGLLAFIPLKTNPGRKLFACVAGFGMSIIVFGLSRNFFLSFVVLVFSGIFDAVSVVIRSTILQLVTPDNMRGRVASVNTMFISSSNELGDFESGLMATWLGTARAIVAGGMITLTVVLTTFLGNKKLKDFQFEEKQIQ